MSDIASMIDPVKGHVSGAIFADRDVYEQELKTVWQKTWVFLAHDSMLPKKGDFLQTYIGEDPVIVVRNKEGGISAFLNQCRHRGMRICRADRGKATVSYTHLTLPTKSDECRSRWSPYH